MFLQVSVIHSVHKGGHAWFYSGGHVWFYLGACVVLFGGACVVLFRGWGACMVLFGGMRGFIWGGLCGFILGGMRGFIVGGMHGFIQGGMHGFILGGVCGFFSFFGYNEIRSMSGRYTSYWNAFLSSKLYTKVCHGLMVGSRRWWGPSWGLKGLFDYIKYLHWIETYQNGTLSL